MSLCPPPSNLSAADLARLGLKSLPAPPGWEAITAWIFEDTGEFVTDDEEMAAMIREAFPESRIVFLPRLHG